MADNYMTDKLSLDNPCGTPSGISRNILIVGVGQQGNLLAGRVIGRLAVTRGRDVKISEVHGMSQRGGSVVTYVRYSDSVASPLIEPGGADVLIAFELLEAVRWLHYLMPSGKIAASTQKIDPMPVIAGNAVYPEGLAKKLHEKYADALTLDAAAIAMQCGTVRSANFVMLGAASGFLEFTIDEWMACMREATPQRALDVNIAAFEAGRRLSIDNAVSR